jgi:hypothetical protein
VPLAALTIDVYTHGAHRRPTAPERQER